MLESMTGFVEVSDKTGTARIQISLKSVNGKYLNIHVSVNRQCLAIEQEVHRIIKKHFSRGSFAATVTIRDDALVAADLSGIAQAMRKLPDSLKPMSIEIGSVLHFV